jgi:hypothetical protein
MNKYIGFDTDSKKTVAYVVQKSKTVKGGIKSRRMSATLNTALNSLARMRQGFIKQPER